VCAGVYQLEAELAGLFRSAASFPASWSQNIGGLWTPIGGGGVIMSGLFAGRMSGPFLSALVVIPQGPPVPVRVEIEVIPAWRSSGYSPNPNSPWLGYDIGTLLFTAPPSPPANDSPPSFRMVLSSDGSVIRMGAGQTLVARFPRRCLGLSSNCRALPIDANAIENGALLKME
jgi:hypothetical protein